MKLDSLYSESTCENCSRLGHELEFKNTTIERLELELKFKNTVAENYVARALAKIEKIIPECEEALMALKDSYDGKACEVNIPMAVRRIKDVIRIYKDVRAEQDKDRSARRI